ncbi:DUF1801 domain-containing protein [Massilia sp. 9I]|uniref:DUF1801 domain-containing protein n=1 Tax=Massilia sp. 9I TaxID=2653152 RepID=UPI0012F2BEE2|nr:DUF1801 domain-containing protein [Massilia sp. 9I]VXC50455.1 conserved hypothetical protein [Massilia sp. 9I]
MAENKTKANGASVRAYLDAIPDAARRPDCEAIVALMNRVTGASPVMWGDSIVGFDSYHYKYASGREGDAPLTGFSSRKGDISIYLSCELPQDDALLGRLGRHKMGKACLYLRRLDDVDLGVLEQLVARAAQLTRARYAA